MHNIDDASTLTDTSKPLKIMHTEANNFYLQDETVKMSITNLTAQLHLLQQQLSEYHNQFELCTAQFNKQLMEYDAHIHASANILTQCLQNAKATLVQKTEQSKNQLNKHTATMKDDLMTHTQQITTSVKQDITAFTDTILTSLKSSINEHLMEIWESHFENFKFNLQNHMSTLQTQAIHILHWSQQQIKNYCDTILMQRTHTTHIQSPPNAPPTDVPSANVSNYNSTKMHPKFHVDPNYAKELLKRPSTNNLPPYLRTPITSDTTINHIVHPSIPQSITAPYTGEDDENGIGPIFIPDTTHQPNIYDPIPDKPTQQNHPILDNIMPLQDYPNIHPMDCPS